MDDTLQHSDGHKWAALAINDLRALVTALSSRVAVLEKKAAASDPVKLDSPVKGAVV